MMKLLYIFGEMKQIDNYFMEGDLKSAMNHYTKEENPRIIRLVSEAFAIKGERLYFCELILKVCLFWSSALIWKVVSCYRVLQLE